jgi:hypothetical protein
MRHTKSGGMCSIVHMLFYSFNLSTSSIGYAGCWDRKAHVRCITSLGSGGTLYTPLSSAPRSSTAMDRSTVGCCISQDCPPHYATSSNPFIFIPMSRLFQICGQDFEKRKHLKSHPALPFSRGLGSATTKTYDTTLNSI